MKEHKKIRLFGSRDFSGNFDMALDFIKQNYAPIIRSIALLIPILLVAVFFMPTANSMTRNMAGSTNPFDIYASIFTPRLILAYLMMLCTTFLMMLFTISYMALYSKSKDGIVDSKEAWRKAVRAFFPMFGASIVFWIIFIIGFVLCFIPGIIAAVYLGFYIYVYINEGTGFIDSFQRSIDLVKNNFWVTFGFCVVFGLLVMIGGFVFAIPTYIGTMGQAFQIDFLTSDIYTYIATLISSLGSLILYPILYMALGVLYYSLRNETEGLDMEDEIDLIGTSNDHYTKF